MLAEVKKCADSNDIKGLHYIFVDCLDVDPTFEKYAADFEYCKNIKGFLEPHINMSPILSKERWNIQYWTQLKNDLIKNFSEKRFSHMREVAKVIYSDKIERLRREREKNTKIIQNKIKQQEQHVTIESEKTVNSMKKNNSVPTADEQNKMLAERRRALELQNQQIERKQQEQRARINAAQQADKEKSGNVVNNQTSKKDMGVVITGIAAVAIVVVVILIIVLLK